MEKKANVLEKIIFEIFKAKPKSSADLDVLKKKLAKKFKISTPSNVDLLKAYHNLRKNKRLKTDEFLETLFIKKPIRSLSGIVNISVLTKPYPCPGNCIFCPTEKNLPKSYVSGEPAVQRAVALKFDPFLQVKKRIEMLENQGHPTDKIELRIIGGSFTFYPKRYQTWFLKKCFDAANGKNSKNLKEAQKRNEKSKHRIVGISIETRPDLITEKEIKNLRELGITMVEIGVQTVFDDILKKSKTGLNVAKIEKATRLLKDAGFKVMYQMMPNLPGATPKKDKLAFKEIFSNPKFKPDWLKIYSCLVLKESKLYRWWKEGKYKSYSNKDLFSIIKYIKSICPPWVRIARIYRDIPKEKIVSGCKISNLREKIKEKMEKENLFCKCIRCREVRGDYNPNEKIYLFRQDYESSGGKEIFLSYETKNQEKLYSFLRIRIPSQVFSKEKHFIPVLQNSAIIRELHTYGKLLSLEKKEKRKSPQHQGLGKKLIREAEKIISTEFAKKLNIKKIAVISGVGVREYYRKLGYRLKDTYMIKSLKAE